jgi:glycolate oxidase iron-sulfur subunit
VSETEARTEPSGGALGAAMPAGTRFVGSVGRTTPAWPGPDAPSDADLSACVACGLCLPHCPTYRLTGEESASPRGRIAAMRAVAEGEAVVDDTFASFMDLCLSCRACEDVCPSHVPFGRMMERARTQIEPLRSRRARLVRWLGLDVILPRPRLVSIVAAATPLALPLLPRRVRSVVPHTRPPRRADRLPAVTEPRVPARGTVALLSGCAQDRWYRTANLATIRVLARNGWRVIVPPGQACCGALAAHYGHLDTARKLARRNARAFASAEWIIVNAAGCGAHMKEYETLVGAGDDPHRRASGAAGVAGRVRDLMEFLSATDVIHPVRDAGIGRVAYHDACHALRAQGIRAQPRSVLRAIPGIELVDVDDGGECCGAAGLYNVLQPDMSGELRRRKIEAIVRTDAAAVASANPGCTMQLTAGLREREMDVPVLHPVELLDRAYERSDA